MSVHISGLHVARTFRRLGDAALVVVMLASTALLVHPTNSGQGTIKGVVKAMAHPDAFTNLAGALRLLAFLWLVLTIAFALLTWQVDRTSATTAVVVSLGIVTTFALMGWVYVNTPALGAVLLALFVVRPGARAFEKRLSAAEPSHVASAPVEALKAAQTA